MADMSHSFISYYKRATSPLVVLLLLQDHSMYGYEISTEMAERSNGMFTIAVLYPVLYRLVEQGYIEAGHTEVIEGRARTYYEITPAGQAYLKQSLAEYEEMDKFLKKLCGPSKR